MRRRGAAFRRNAGHLAKWLALAVIGVCALAMLRYSGQVALARKMTQTQLSNIVDEYQHGDTTEAQKKLYAVIARRPELASTVLEQFGPRLMGMPRVLDLMPQDAAPRGHSGPAPANEIEMAIWRGDAIRAKELYDSLAPARVPATLAFWRARQALMDGDVKHAKQWFDRYWAGNARRRAERVDDLSREYSNAFAEKTNAMLWEGLWDEAFAEARGHKSPQDDRFPELLCRAVEEDLNGNTVSALRDYTEALLRQPANYLALLRSHALKDAGSPSH